MTGSLLTVKSPLNISCLPSLLKPATPVEVIPLAQGQSLGTLKIPRFRSNRNVIRKRESQEWLPSTRNQGNASGAHLNESLGSRAPAKPVLIVHDSCLSNPTRRPFLIIALNPNGGETEAARIPDEIVKGSRR